MWVAKLAAVLAGSLSAIALLVHFAVPLSRDFVVSTLPAAWTSVRIFLVPPYLFLTVNFIVAVIWVLSEKMHRQQQQQQSDKNTEPTIEVTFLKPTTFDSHHSHHFPATADARWSHPPSSPLTPSSPVPVAAEPEKASAASDPDETPAAVEDEAISLDATWEVILGGGDAPSKKALKKGETWEVAAPVKNGPGLLGRRAEMKKSETFSESRRRAPVLREAVVVLGNDELDRKFEAFIKKVNDQIRLQRQESYQRYVDLIGRRTNFHP